MGQDDFDAMFSQIMGAQDDMPNLDADAPAADDRPNGLHYHATNADIATYHLVYSGRVIFHVRVSNLNMVDMPAVFAGKVHPQATAHPIFVATPDGGTVLPTSGVALMGKHHLNSDSIRLYVFPRLLDLVIQLYGIGA